MPARRRTSLIGFGKFTFFGVQGSVAELGWDNQKQERLWRYNQHYFDDLNALEAEHRGDWHMALLADWVEQNAPGTGTGWEPYPTSLRIVNWVKWAWGGNVLSPACVHSLAIQARWLSKRIEWHLLGNHLFANAKALVFVGLVFQGDEANCWLENGLRILDRELPEQVLPDGGNFERSPMYHAIFLEDILDLINAAQASLGRIDSQRARRWQEVAERMLRWLKGMTHPDGEIALFNDSSPGIAPNPAELERYANKLGIGVGTTDETISTTPTYLNWPDSGYIRLNSTNATAFLDVALIGPDYLPGHAHADTLSFELSLFGHRVIVNGGTSRYGLGPERLRERQTVAHSTVEIDSKSSSEVWGGFRVARRAYPMDMSISSKSDMISVACSHDGYTRFPGKPVHRRTWRMRNGVLDVADLVTGIFGLAVARYIIHPDVSIAERSPHAWELKLPMGEQVMVQVVTGNGRLEPAKYAPEFGYVKQTHCLAVVLDDGEALVRLGWC